MTEGSDHHLLFEETPGGAEELKAEVKHDYSSSHDGIVPLSVGAEPGHTTSRSGSRCTPVSPTWRSDPSSTPTATGSVSC